MPESPKDLFNRYIRAIATRDFATLESMIHPDFVGEYPQSGERFRGFASLRAQLEHLGAPPTADFPIAAKVVGDEERWAITPGYTVLPLAGPDRYTTVSRARYPDGSLWWVVSIVDLRDDKIYRTETYFAPDFEPPEWRRGMVESMPRGQ